MTDKNERETAWFRHQTSGQVFEAEGAQLQNARKNRDLEEVSSPEAALKMELDKREIKYSPNAKMSTLQKLLADALAKEAGDDGE